MTETASGALEDAYKRVCELKPHGPSTPSEAYVEAHERFLDEIERLLDAGVRPAEIGTRLGLTRSAVVWWIRKRRQAKKYQAS